MILFLEDDVCGGLGAVVAVIRGLFNVFKIIVPILLLIMGAVDLAKAVIASDDKEIKAATTKLTKRSIAAAAVFFAVTIVEVVTSLINNKQWQECWNGPGSSGAGESGGDAASNGD